VTIPVWVPSVMWTVPSSGFMWNSMDQVLRGSTRGRSESDSSSRGRVLRSRWVACPELMWTDSNGDINSGEPSIRVSRSSGTTIIVHHNHRRKRWLSLEITFILGINDENSKWWFFFRQLPSIRVAIIVLDGLQRFATSRQFRISFFRAGWSSNTFCNNLFPVVTVFVPG
jgi:hypothetical protein